MTQVLYGALGGISTTSDLYTIDPATAVATPIGPIGFAVTGLAVDPTDGTLYGVTSNNSAANPRSLISIDPVTGAGTLIGALSIGVGASDICVSATGQIYGWSTGSAHGLLAINKATGAATAIGAGTAATGGGLAFDSGGTLYRVSGFGTRFLETINPATGADTFIMALAGSLGIGAMKFDAVDVLYAIDTTGFRLITINVGTGTVTFIANTTAQMDALAWADVTAGASVTLTPTTGVAGSSVSIDGTGFTASSALSATFDGSAVTLGGTTSTDGAGAFTGATFTVPALPAGTYTVTVTDGGAISASATFTILASNTDCASAEELRGCSGTVEADNRGWAGTWPTGADPLFNLFGEGGGAPLWWKWTNHMGRKMLFRVAPISPADHAVNYNGGVAVGSCGSLDMDWTLDDIDIRTEFGTSSENSNPAVPTYFDVVVGPGQTVYFELDSYSGDASEPPDASAHLGKFKFDWAALDTFFYDSIETSTELIASVSPAGNLTPLDLIEHDGRLWFAWASSTGDGDDLYLGDCLPDGTDFNSLLLSDASTDAKWDRRETPAQLATDGTDVFFGFGYLAQAGDPDDAGVNPDAVCDCAGHTEVVNCFDDDDHADQDHYLVFSNAGGWSLIADLTQDPLSGTPTGPFWNFRLSNTGRNIFNARMCASPAQPGRIWVHISYLVERGYFDFYNNNFPVTGTTPTGSIYCILTVDQEEEYLETYELDAAGAIVTATRVAGTPVVVRELDHVDPTINPVFAAWTFYNDGPWVSADTAHYTSIGYDAFWIRNDVGHPVIAYCARDWFNETSSGYANEITLERLDTAAALGSYSFNTLTGQTDAAAFANVVFLTPKIVNAEAGRDEMVLGTDWTTSQVFKRFLHRLDTSGIDAPGFMLDGDLASSHELASLAVFKDGTRNWWRASDKGDAGLGDIDNLDGLCGDDWRTAYSPFDELGGNYSHGLQQGYFADVEPPYMIFLAGNNTLRRYDVLRDYRICLVGEPCTFGVLVKEQGWKVVLG